MPEITIIEAQQNLRRVVGDDRFAIAFLERWNQVQDFSTDEKVRGWNERKCGASVLLKEGERFGAPIRIHPEDVAGIPISDDTKELFEAYFGE